MLAFKKLFGFTYFMDSYKDLLDRGLLIVESSELRLNYWNTSLIARDPHPEYILGVTKTGNVERDSYAILADRMRRGLDYSS
jgi:hypothetical protein